MKNYLLWAGDNYYPGPALSDYQGDFDTVEEAVAAGCARTSEENPFSQPVFDWYEVIEHATMERICYGWKGNPPHA
jgi:hypothetical protein